MKGMTELQAVAARHVLYAQFGAFLHHGDCVGADAHMHEFARLFDMKIVVHPPNRNSLRAFCLLKDGDKIMSSKPYLIRNRDIVDQTQVLIAAPRTMTELLRSGTWSTVRYARRLKRLIIVVWPDGTVTTEN